MTTQSVIARTLVRGNLSHDNMGAHRQPLIPKNTKGDRGVAFSISSRGKLIKNYFCAKNALISSSSKMFCVWKT